MMKTIQAIQFLGARPRQVLGLAALCVLTPLLAWQGYEAFDEGRLMQSEREGLISLSNRNRPGKAPSMSAADRQRHAQIEALAVYLSTPWDQWLAVFEDHATDKGTLRQIEQDAHTGTVKLSARSSSTEHMMGYVKALQSDARLSEVRLQRHEWLRNEPGAPVQFDLTAQFTGATQALPAAGPASAASATPVSAAAKQPIATATMPRATPPRRRS